MWPLNMHEILLHSARVSVLCSRARRQTTQGNTAIATVIFWMLLHKQQQQQ